MSEIPIGQFEPGCPQCGAKLLVEYDGAEVRADDKVVCGSCGFTESVAETRNSTLDQNKSEIEQAIADHVRDLLRKTFGKG